MPDEINVADTSEAFEPHPEGGFAAVCVDSIALGMRVKVFGKDKPRIVPVCALVYQTGKQNEKGILYDLSREFTISMFPTAGLRQWLEAWRGKSFSDAQAKTTIALHKLVGVGALVQVEHRTSQRQRTYATIQTIMPLPEGMTKPVVPAYTRPVYWAERKTAYADEVATWRAANTPVVTDDVDIGPVNRDGDDDLPF